MAIVIRYAHNNDDDMEIKERFIALVNCEVTTGEEITKYVCQSLQRLGIDLRKCVGTLFDGDSNMQGQHKGVATRLQAEAPMSINIYCGAHGSNLVMKACSKSSTTAVNLYGTDFKPNLPAD